MAWNGAGVYTLSAAYYPEVNGTTIDAVRYNGLMADIATGINKAFAKDGQNVPTANLPMGGFKFTGLAAGSASGDSVRYEQVALLGESTVTGHATTADIFAAASQRVLFDGTGIAITAFPSGGGTALKLVRFNGVNTLTHSSGLVCPGSINITTASGDYALIASVSTNAVVTGYFPAAGLVPRLNQVLAANAAGALSNGDNAQSWSWSLSTASKTGLTITESSASSGANTILFKTEALDGSTANPLAAIWNGSVTDGFIGFSTVSADGDVLIQARTDSTSSTGGQVYLQGGAAKNSTGSGGPVVIRGGASGSSSGVGGDISLNAGSGSGGTASGGDVSLVGGASSGSGQGGSIVLTPGKADSTSSGAVWVDGGPLAMTVHSTAKPTVTGAGTGATVTGSDGCFIVTAGTSPTTLWSITFSRPMGATGTIPRIIITPELSTMTPLPFRIDSAASRTGFDVRWSASPGSTNSKIHVLVIPTSDAIS